MSTSSYGSHDAHSRGSHGNTRQQTGLAQIARLCSVMLVTYTMYIIFFSGDDESRGGDQNNREGRGFKLRNVATHRDRRPEFGPVNDPRIQMGNDSEKLQKNLDINDEPDSFANNKDDNASNFSNGHIPQALENVADVNAGPFQRGIDVPFYWHVPRSGGGTISDVLGR